MGDNTGNIRDEQTKGHDGSRSKLAKQWLMPIGFSLMFLGAFNLYGYSKDKIAVDHYALTDNNAISGRIEKSFSGRSTYLGFRDESNQLVECYVGLCGYEGWEAHIGKQAKIWLADGKVVQISVDGTIRKSAAETLGSVRRTLNRGLLLVGAGLVLLVFDLRRARHLGN